MTRKHDTSFDRRRFMQVAGAVGAIGVAGCQSGGDGDDGDGGDGDDGDGGDAPAKEQAVEEWGQRLNDHAREADIDWKQFEGESLMFGMNVHPFTSLMKDMVPYFEELTGITVQFNEFPEDQLWQRLTLDLEGETGLFDGFFMGLWPSAQYHANGWVQDLNEFIEDPNLTDQDWLAMEDYPDSVIDALSYGQNNELTGIPFGIEAYGVLGYDRPTFETLGLEPPESYPEMRDAAKEIHESDEVDRIGIASRASSTTLSSANWATVFKSHDAEWIDRSAREATLNSEEGVASLEIFADMMGNYGPPDIGSFDWYRSNTAFGAGDLGMVLHTNVAIGVWEQEQRDRTEWIPPVPGPDGSQVADTWTWALGISEFTQNAEAAWLFLQWANSREANLLASVPAWEGHPTYGWAREGYIFDQPEWEELGLKDSWVEAHLQGLEMVPSDPPPVPLDTPQNMDIMSEAAIAMNSAVTGQKSAQQALDDAAPTITELAKEIPDEYL
jgi:multiple sugar transport system substrate-binding protein